ncbi:MAG: glycosyltransferase family 39 protein [Gemmataceae bacterium]|nr:glycosyltransferase family 39 protein [Gemmataceae bacterium]
MSVNAGGQLSMDGAIDRYSRRNRHLSFCALFAVAALLFFLHFRCPLQEPQEPRYAEISRRMLTEGSFVIPVYQGQPYYDKPPLLYWLVIGSYRVFGIHDWAARLVPCLAGFLCVLAVHQWGRRTVGERAAFAGALMLCLSARFVQLERMLTMDGLLCLWVIAAWAAGHIAILNGQRRWWIASALACGLGLLTKGPVALVLVVVPIAFFAWQARRIERPSWMQWFLYLSTGIAVAAPWFIAVTAMDPSFVDHFFWRHHVQRYVEPFDHAEPLWFFLPDVFLGMLPWTLLVPGLLAFAFRRRNQRPAVLTCFLPAFAWCLFFFSLSGCKRSAYILPAMPPLALALGCYVDALLCESAAATRRRVAWIGSSVLTFAGLFFGAFQLMPDYARKYSLRGIVRRHAAEPNLSAVVSYPRHWDSVSFYLQRNDVRSFSPERLHELMAQLLARPDTLVFVKSERWLVDFLKHLPTSLEFVPQGRQGYVRVGLVRRRETWSE